MCHHTNTLVHSKFLATRLTQPFGAKGVFGLYKGRMLVGAVYVTATGTFWVPPHLTHDGPSIGDIALPKVGQLNVCTNGKIWHDFLPSTLSGVVWHGCVPAKNCCRA